MFATISYSVRETNILRSVFISSVPSKVIITVIQFMSLGLIIFRALLRAHFAPRPKSRAKVSRSQAQNIVMPANIDPIVLSREESTL